VGTGGDTGKETMRFCTTLLPFLPLFGSPRCSWAPVATPARRRWDFVLMQAAQALVGTGGDTGKETVRFCTTLCPFCRSSGRPGARGHRWRHRQGDGEILYYSLSFLPLFRPPRRSWHRMRHRQGDGEIVYRTTFCPLLRPSRRPWAPVATPARRR
jgi:hypothetical protein